VVDGFAYRLPPVARDMGRIVRRRSHGVQIRNDAKSNGTDGESVIEFVTVTPTIKLLSIELKNRTELLSVVSCGYVALRCVALRCVAWQ